jgi:hypothetical protein
MKSVKRGKNISEVEVSHISARGFWLLIKDREHFVDFDQNGWFKNATVAQILKVQLLHGHHLYWPDLDVDLEIEALAKPEDYPLIFK